MKTGTNTWGDTKMNEALEPPQQPGPRAVTGEAPFVPEYVKGHPGKYQSSFQFDAGELVIRQHGHSTKDGSGYFSFKDDDLHHELGEESSIVYRSIEVLNDDLVYLRDKLLEIFPTSAPAPGDVEVQRLKAEVERLEKLVYVPGQWRCAKCKFALQRTTIDVVQGRMGISERDRNEPEQCPNGCGPLWRVSERDAGNEAISSYIAREEELCKALDVDCYPKIIPAIADLKARKHPSPPLPAEIAEIEKRQQKRGLQVTTSTGLQMIQDINTLLRHIKSREEGVG